MKLIIEIEPTRRLEKLSRLLRRLINIPCISMVSIPDAPLGKPKASALALASYAEHYGMPAIAHMRLRDINRIAFEQLVWGAALIGVRRVLFLRGDKPLNATDVNDVTTESAAEYMHAHRDRLQLEFGVYLSLRHPLDAVRRRIHRCKADFYTVNWFNPRAREHKNIVDEVHSLGARIYAYAILGERNIIPGLEDQPVHAFDELPSLLESYSDAGVDGVILSAPGAMHTLLDIIEKRVCSRERW